MKLTIKQALRKGVTAHKEGKLQDAESLYRAILKSQPAHPDANHNLGILAVATNQVEAALPFLKKALEVNPKIEQFWVSYINALIKVKQFENAKQVIQQGKLKVVNIERLKSIEGTLDSLSKEKNVNSLSPSKKQLSNLLEQFQIGNFWEAEKIAVSITEKFPNHYFAWTVLGTIFSQKGRKVEAADAAEKAAILSPQNAEAHYNFANTLQELGRLEESEASYTKAIALKPDFAEAHSNLGITLEKLERFYESKASYERAIKFKPEYPKAHFNLGKTLQQLGSLNESQANYKKAIALKPDYAEAYNNLGVTLQELRRLDEAEANYKQAIALKPDFAEANYNLGNMLKELGRLDEAEANYKQAIALKPDYAEAYINLGVTLEELGKLDEACSGYIQAINLDPNYNEAYLNLSLAIKKLNFTSSDSKFYPIMVKMLTVGNIIRPEDLAFSILRLLKHDPLIKGLLAKKDIIASLKEFNSRIKILHKFPLLHHLMRICPFPDLQFERLFVMIRSFLLSNISKIETSPELVYFLSSLCLHCFTNEYVYPESEEETQLVESLETEIEQAILKSEHLETLKILCIASYRSLDQYDWYQKVKALDHLKDVKKRLIDEPNAEKEIAKEIAILGQISDNVSCKVRKQYEENPYPKWVKLALPIKEKSIAEVCEDIKLHLHSECIKNVTAATILIAGCGTGQHAIETASRFSSCHVTAVDLSSASLAYAKRKTTELKINNLEYLQADILELENLGKKFDIIESGGVLHHMDEPMAGWRILTDILKPNGLMRIGLYSELARQHIVAIRNEITSLKVGASEVEIRKFRGSLAESNDKNHKLLTQGSDFFCISELRDSIFHVQEHRFNLLQIKNCLGELGLKFCGFENRKPNLKFRELYGKEADICNLELWNQFEDSNPRSFANMYQFWCQKM